MSRANIDRAWSTVEPFWIRGSILVETRNTPGQTFGVVSFPTLTTLRRDLGDDPGVRLSGLDGFALCVVAGIVFSRDDEARITGGEHG